MASTALVVGCGHRGQDWIRTIQSEPGWSLNGIVDTDQGNLASTRATHGLSNASTFTTLSSAFERAVPDAVVIASPAEKHHEAAQEALKTGCAILVEKPFAEDLQQAKEIVSLGDQVGRPIVVGQNYRYMRAHRTARDVVRSGLIGRPLLIEAHYYRVPHEMSPSLARSKWTALWGAGIHHLDAMRHVLGNEISRVSAHTSTVAPERSPAGASMQALLAFEDGTAGTYTCSYESSGHQFFEGGQEFYERIVGDAGTLHMFHRWLFLCLNNKLPRLVRRGKRNRTEEVILLGELGKAIAGLPYECSGRDNLHTMAVVEACIRSSELDEAVDPRKLLDE